MRQKGVAFPWKKGTSTGTQQQQQPQPSSSSSTPAAQPDLDSETEEEIPFHSSKPGLMIPDVFTELPPVRDVLVTKTSNDQDETVGVCLPFLGGEDEAVEYNEHGVPGLDRAKHVKFLHQSLGKLPGRFVAADASRPWFLYWCLSALSMLGEDVTSYRESIIETARSMQNETGGFGGGGGQLSHMATTYAVVLSLALVGGEDVYDVVDRKAMWRWLCSLKQPDGGFQVCLGGEEDIRYVCWLSGRLPSAPANRRKKGRILRSCYHFPLASSSRPDPRVSGICRRRQRKPLDGRGRLCPAM